MRRATCSCHEPTGPHTPTPLPRSLPILRSPVSPSLALHTAISIEGACLPLVSSLSLSLSLSGSSPSLSIAGARLPLVPHLLALRRRARVSGRVCTAAPPPVPDHRDAALLFLVTALLALRRRPFIRGVGLLEKLQVQNSQRNICSLVVI